LKYNNIMSRVDTWDQNYDILIQYVEENNKIPAKPVIYKDTHIGIWCQTQRSDKTISQKRQDKLMQIKGWKFDYVAETWEERYNYVKHSIDVEFVSPQDDEHKSWVAHQKRLYKLNQLSQDHIDKLNDIKYWYWTLEDETQAKFEYVRDYVTKYHKFPRGKHEWFGDLYKWLGVQRTNYKKNTMPADKRVQFETIPYWPNEN